MAFGKSEYQKDNKNTVHQRVNSEHNINVINKTIKYVKEYI